MAVKVGINGFGRIGRKMNKTTKQNNTNNNKNKNNNKQQKPNKLERLLEAMTSLAGK